MSNEMRGLAAVINSAGTLHTYADAPERDAFETDEDFQVAYRDWQRRMTYWTVETRKP